MTGHFHARLVARIGTLGRLCAIRPTVAPFQIAKVLCRERRQIENAMLMTVQEHALPQEISLPDRQLVANCGEQ
jgi:hypothetical protein